MVEKEPEQVQVSEEEKETPVDSPDTVYDEGLPEEPVKIRGVGGIIKEYILRCMEGFEREKYIDEFSAKVRFDAAGKPLGLKNYKGMETDLLSRCLWTPDGKRVPREWVNGLPPTVLSSLYKRAEKLCSLDKGSRQAAKNG